jgi:hypothetical protein
MPWIGFGIKRPISVAPNLKRSTTVPRRSSSTAVDALDGVGRHRFIAGVTIVFGIAALGITESMIATEFSHGVAAFAGAGRLQHRTRVFLMTFTHTPPK